MVSQINVWWYFQLGTGKFNFIYHPGCAIFNTVIFRINHKFPRKMWPVFYINFSYKGDVYTTALVTVLYFIHDLCTPFGCNVYLEEVIWSSWWLRGICITLSCDLWVDDSVGTCYTGMYEPHEGHHPCLYCERWKSIISKNTVNWCHILSNWNLWFNLIMVGICRSPGET